ncbi:MAG: hypothetical protein LC803_06690 [Acidobacteria bacterium]|nr:hypothetical protein [Acidobacteriota bacterium]
MCQRALLGLLRQALIVCLMAPAGMTEAQEQRGRTHAPEVGGSRENAAAVSALTSCSYFAAAAQ